MAKEIELDTFMKLFMAISYTHEQRYFNFAHLTGYLWQNFVAEDDVIDQMEDIIDQMVNDKILISEEGYEDLYQISNEIDYMNIIKNNIEYLNDMKKFFMSYYNNFETSIVISNSKQKNNR